MEVWKELISTSSFFCNLLAEVCKVLNAKKKIFLLALTTSRSSFRFSNKPSFGNFGYKLFNIFLNVGF